MSASLVAKLGSRECMKVRMRLRLQLIDLPDALHRAQRDADRLRHGSAGPMGRLVRRSGAGERDHPCCGLRCNRRFAGLAGLVAQQAFNPGLGVALLPAPYRRSADADAGRDPVCRFPLGTGQNDARSVHILPRLVALTDNRLQPVPVRSADDHTYCLSHRPNIAHSTALVNLLNASVH